MSITFFCVGAVIFTVYMYFTVWNIYNSQTTSKRKDYPNLGSEGCDLPNEYIDTESKQPKTNRKPKPNTAQGEKPGYKTPIRKEVSKQ